MRKWPDMLPTPSLPGFGLIPVDTALRTDMEVGAPRARRISLARLDTVDLQWQFTDVEMAAFRAWWGDEAYSLVGDSDDLAPWTLSAATLSADALFGPENVMADSIVETTANAAHYISRSLGAGGVAGATALCRATLKAAGRTRARLRLVDRAGAIAWTEVDLATGTFGSQSGLLSRSLEDRGDGWWRATLTAPTGVGGSNPAMQIMAVNGVNTTVYAGTVAPAISACEIGARLVTGFDLHLRTGSDGKVTGAAGGSAWVFMPVAVGGGFRWIECRFKEPFKANAGPALNWDVSATVEVRNA